MSTQVNTQTSGGVPSESNNFSSAISNMELILSEVLTKFIQSQAEQQEMNSQFSDALVGVDSASAKNLNSSIYSATHESFWQRLLGDLGVAVEVVVFIAGAITGNFEVCAAVAGMAILEATGALGDMAKGIGDAVSDALQAMGVPKDQADEIGQVIGDIATIAIVITAAVMLGAGTGDAAEEGEGALKEADPKEASETKDNSSTFNKKSVGLGAMTGSQATISLDSSMFTEFMELVDPHGKHSKEIAEILALVTDLAAVAGGIAGGVSVAFGSGITTSLGEAVSNAGSKLTGLISDFGAQISESASKVFSAFGEMTSTLEKSAQVAGLAARGVGGLATIGQGSIGIAQANTQIHLADSESDFDLAQTGSAINTSMIEGNTQKMKQGVEELGAAANATDYFGALEGVAVELMQGS